MKVLITGANGFLGKNLTLWLKNSGYTNLLFVNRETSEEQFDSYLKQCDFIFHLAGVNRPKTEDEFVKGNVDFTNKMLNKLKKFSNNCHIVVCSSIQAENDTPYGKSKKAMEDALFSYAQNTSSKIFVYRLVNLYGKWCKPNYNSVVATFCHNISRDIDIKIDDPKKALQLCYIDDVCKAFIDTMEGKPIYNEEGFCQVPCVDTIKLGELALKLKLFNENRKTLEMPAFENDFDRKLYATFISHLPENNFCYSLDKKCDSRGYFCELIKGSCFGQVSVSLTKPTIVRGNHWHNTKAEKFLVVQGEATIRFRKIESGSELSREVIEYFVNGEQLQMIDVPVGYTHSIENVGACDLITIIWCNESFDINRPDTFFEEVLSL